MSSPKQRTRQGWTRWLWSGLSVTIIVTLLLGNSGLVTAAGDALQLLRSAAPPPPEAAMPLTDVAGQPPRVDVQAAEAPTERLRNLGLEQLPAPAFEAQLPTAAMPDLAHPPAWTQPLAAPQGAPVPPDPFKAPPLAVNPERGQPQEPRSMPPSTTVQPTPPPAPTPIPQPLPPVTTAQPPAKETPVTPPTLPDDTIQPVTPDTK